MLSFMTCVPLFCVGRPASQSGHKRTACYPLSLRSGHAITYAGRYWSWWLLLCCLCVFVNAMNMRQHRERFVKLTSLRWHIWMSRITLRSKAQKDHIECGLSWRHLWVAKTKRVTLTVRAIAPTHVWNIPVKLMFLDKSFDRLKVAALPRVFMRIRYSHAISIRRVSFNPWSLRVRRRNILCVDRFHFSVFLCVYRHAICDCPFLA